MGLQVENRSFDGEHSRLQCASRRYLSECHPSIRGGTLAGSSSFALSAKRGGAALNTHELPNNSRYWMRCRATTLMNSRDVIILVPFQNSGKCRWLPVIR